MKEIVCVDLINKKSIFIGETGDMYFSNSTYAIGESECKDNLCNIDALSPEEQLEIKNTL